MEPLSFGAKRTRAAGDDVDRMRMAGDPEGHRVFVDKLLRLTGDPLEQVRSGRVVFVKYAPVPFKAWSRARASKFAEPT